MKLVRAAAVVAGLADLGFALLFIIKPDALYDNPEVKGLIYPRWVGVCALASAVMLFIAVSDPKRYLPMVFVNAGARALVALVCLRYIVSSLALAVTMLASHGALAAILIGALVYDLKLGQYKVSVSRTGGEGKKPGKHPAPKPAAGKKRPAKAESKKSSSGGGGKG